MSQLHIKNGQVVDADNAEKAYRSQGTGAQTAASRAKTKNTEFNKDMFLKLLAAEMQYQDPMAPTQNSEYVAEMATFAQVEATQNVSKSVDSISASNLIGKYVTVDTEEGNVTGIVDYITKKDDGIYVTVNNNDYLADKVTSVKDAAYFEATKTAEAFSGMMSKLPEAKRFSMFNEKDLNLVNNFVKNISGYARQFLNKNDLNKLKELNQRYQELIKNDSKNNNKTKKPEKAEKAENIAADNKNVEKKAEK